MEKVPLKTAFFIIEIEVKEGKKKKSGKPAHKRSGLLTLPKK